MELKGRLKLIADKTPVCRTACDIGTDHAYIPISLVLNDKCDRAIAADVNAGPLNAARENIRQFGLEDRIDSRLGDGLDPIGEQEADAVIIAGMGGGLIRDILNRNRSKAEYAEALILQPMNALEELREWLYENGYVILDEELTREGEKIYTVFLAKWTGSPVRYEPIDLYIGRRLIEKKDPLLSDLLRKKLAQTKQVLRELEGSSGNPSALIQKNSYLLEQYSKILIQGME